MSAVNRKRMQFGTTVDSTSLERFREIADLTDIPISKLTDKAFELLIDYYDKHKTVPYSITAGSHTLEGFKNEYRSNNIEEELTGYEKLSKKLEQQTQVELDENTNPQLNVNDIINIDLNEIQNALNIIKSFQDKITNNANIIEKAKNMSFNEFKKSFNKYVNRTIDESEVPDSVHENNKESLNSSTPQINTNKSK